MSRHVDHRYARDRSPEPRRSLSPRNSNKIPLSGRKLAARLSSPPLPPTPLTDRLTGWQDGRGRPKRWSNSTDYGYRNADDRRDYPDDRRDYPDDRREYRVRPRSDSRPKPWSRPYEDRTRADSRPRSPSPKRENRPMSQSVEAFTKGLHSALQSTSARALASRHHERLQRFPLSSTAAVAEAEEKVKQAQRDIDTWLGRVQESCFRMIQEEMRFVSDQPLYDDTPIRNGLDRTIDSVNDIGLRLQGLERYVQDTPVQQPVQEGMTEVADFGRRIDALEQMVLAQQSAPPPDNTVSDLLQRVGGIEQFIRDFPTGSALAPDDAGIVEEQAATGEAPVTNKTSVKAFMRGISNRVAALEQGHVELEEKCATNEELLWEQHTDFTEKHATWEQLEQARHPARTRKRSMSRSEAGDRRVESSRQTTTSGPSAAVTISSDDFTSMLSTMRDLQTEVTGLREEVEAMKAGKEQEVAATKRWIATGMNAAKDEIAKSTREVLHQILVDSGFTRRPRQAGSSQSQNPTPPKRVSSLGATRPPMATTGRPATAEPVTQTAPKGRQPQGDALVSPKRMSVPNQRVGSIPPTGNGRSISQSQPMASPNHAYVPHTTSTYPVVQGNAPVFQQQYHNPHALASPGTPTHARPDVSYQTLPGGPSNGFQPAYQFQQQQGSGPPASGVPSMSYSISPSRPTTVVSQQARALLSPTLYNNLDAGMLAPIAYDPGELSPGSTIPFHQVLEQYQQIRLNQGAQTAPPAPVQQVEQSYFPPQQPQMLSDQELQAQLQAQVHQQTQNLRFQPGSLDMSPSSSAQEGQASGSMGPTDFTSLAG